MRLACLVGLGVAVLVLGGSAVGADNAPPVTVDSLTPDASLTLGVGAAKTLHPTLHLVAQPPKADVLLAFDTTGSMGAAITDARSDADSLVSSIQGSISNTKFAIADFQDYPASPFGLETDHPWKIDQNFTDNSGSSSCNDGDFHVTPITCALNHLTAPSGSGNDGPRPTTAPSTRPPTTPA